MEQKNTFELLDRDLQKWIFRKGWKDLLPIQKASVGPILKCKDDIIISASTASGKTEAAFLPAITAICKTPQKKGVRILYISPLKALINDQYRRLDEMTSGMALKVTPWHGDVSANKKEQILRNPEGIILTTPESLESMLINHVNWLQKAFDGLDFIIIDEFHAFIGTARGYQLQSQLHRIDNLVGRQVVRIGISATFAEASGVISHLRPNSYRHCEVISQSDSGTDKLSIQIRGYEIKEYLHNTEDATKDTPPDLKEEKKHISQEFQTLSNDIFRLLRGATNLVFCNSRFYTEAIAGILQNLSVQHHVPNEFFPHHGSLSKDMRESLEYRLQQGKVPTTAICTATLELGIDISNVQSIAQIDPPSTVSSLRQRLGRSGRRDHLAVLRLFIPEYTGLRMPLCSILSENTVLSIAMINLLLKRWYEPPYKQEYAFSTLLQQTLSVIASYGSVSAFALYNLLCKTGPFSICSPKVYSNFLRDLGNSDLIVQLNDGTLTLGLEGEKLVSDWGFYASFKTPDEYTIEADNKKIGTVPLTRSLEIDDVFLFAGRGWKVVFFSEERKLIGVKNSNLVAEPLMLYGSSGQIHDTIREEMYKIYIQEEIPQFLNKQAKLNLTNGIKIFKSLGLKTHHIVNGPQGLAIFPWKGDCILRTLMLLLKKESIKASIWGSHLELGFTSLDSLKVAIFNLLDRKEINGTDLVSKIRNLNLEKNDEYLSVDLKRLSYAHSKLDIEGACDFLKLLYKEIQENPPKSVNISWSTSSPS